MRTFATMPVESDSLTSVQSQSVRRSSVVAIGTLLVLSSLSACGQTPSARIIDQCIIGPNNSCVQANLANADLSGRTVKGTDFTLANLRNANLQKADFAGADLFQTDMTGAKVAGANFAAANMIGTICPSGKMASGSPALCPDLPVKAAS